MAKPIVISCRLCPGCWNVIQDGRCPGCRNANSAVYRLKLREQGRPKGNSDWVKRKLTRRAKSEITAKDVRDVLEYDPSTGDFSRRGKKAILGSLNESGYLKISLFGWMIRAHRLAWLYVHGVWPETMLDHINGSKIDNRIANLREVTDELNCQNLRTPKSHNRSGFLGVVLLPTPNKWAARITVAGKTNHLGVFDSPEEASQEYLKAKRLLHEGCTI